MNERQMMVKAFEMAKKAGKQLLANFRKQPPTERGTSKEAKSTFDNLADEMIKGDLEKNFPDHSYLTEETGLVCKGSKYLWVVDPNDGTSCFMNHNPFFAVSIAVWKNNNPLMGVIYAPALGEMYSATIGGGAFRRMFSYPQVIQQCFVSQESDPKKSYLVFCEGGEKDKSRVHKTFDKWYENSKDMKKLGSAALELAWVGTGRAEAYITHQISFWDIAAGMIFVKEAGGKILKFDGTEYDLSDFKNFGKYDLIASNGKIKLF